jgi:hypothetical protein
VPVRILPELLPTEEIPFLSIPLHALIRLGCEKAIFSCQGEDEVVVEEIIMMARAHHPVGLRV